MQHIIDYLAAEPRNILEDNSNNIPYITHEMNIFFPKMTPGMPHVIRKLAAKPRNIHINSPNYIIYTIHEKNILINYQTILYAMFKKKTFIPRRWIPSMQHVICELAAKPSNILMDNSKNIIYTTH